MIGVDCGSSFTDVVVFKEGRLKSTFSIPSSDFSLGVFNSFVKSLGNNRDSVVATGSRVKTSILLKRKKAELVDEIESIAAGARFLTGKKDFVVANVGTGTPIVQVEGFEFKHLGGTGVGGGTLDGLSRLLLGLRKVDGLESLALKGSNVLDLSVREAVGGSVGRIPPNATAGNFAKVFSTRKVSPEDVAFSITNMVGEVVGMTTCIAANGAGKQFVVFTGRTVARNALLRRRIKLVCDLFGLKCLFPKNGEFCTALGAVIAASEKKQKR